MKAYNIIGVLTVAASLLFFCSADYAYEVHNETLDHDTDTQTMGNGYAGANDFPDAWAWASAWIDSEDPESGGSAYGYADKKCYITDYEPNDPNLTGYVTGACTAEAYAVGDREDSDYWLKAAGWGYGAGNYASAYVEVTEPEGGDVDTDWFAVYVDMSYEGATVYYGHLGLAQAVAYSTSGEVRVTANGGAQTVVQVQEQGP